MKHNPHQVKTGHLPKKTLIANAEQLVNNCYQYETDFTYSSSNKPTYYGEFNLSSGLKFKPKNIKSVSRDGVAFDSKIERIYYMYKKYIEHANIERNTSEHLDYRNCFGKNSWFYPDFKENGRFVELKGIMSPDDVQKRQQHPEVVWIVQSESFGKQLLETYKEKLDMLVPNWRKM